MPVETYTMQDLGWVAIMRNAKARQAGLCHQCRKEITNKDFIVCRRTSKAVYYHFECAELLNIV